MRLFNSLTLFFFAATSLAAAIPGLDSHDHPDVSPRELGCPGVNECQDNCRDQGWENGVCVGLVHCQCVPQ